MGWSLETRGRNGPYIRELIKCKVRSRNSAGRSIMEGVGAGCRPQWRNETEQSFRLFQKQRESGTFIWYNQINDHKFQNKSQVDGKDH